MLYCSVIWLEGGNWLNTLSVILLVFEHLWWSKNVTTADYRCLIMNLWGIQLKVEPTYRFYINNLYYVTYCMLKLVLEMTSNSQTFFKLRGQIIKTVWRSCCTIADTACVMIYLSLFSVWIIWQQLSVILSFTWLLNPLLSHNVSAALQGPGFSSQMTWHVHVCWSVVTIILPCSDFLLWKFLFFFLRVCIKKYKCVTYIPAFADFTWN